MHEDSILQGEIEDGFQQAEQPVETPPEPAPGSAEEIKDPVPKAPEQPVITQGQLDAEKRAAAAEGRLEAEREHKKDGVKPPQTDPLQEAIDNLPDDQKEIAKDLMPVLEKLRPQGDTVSKAEAAQMVQDAINIQSLDTWKGKMVKTWDGTDGKPKFDWATLDTYMQKKGLTDPSAAFKDMEFEALSDYRNKLKSKVQPTVDSGGKPTPPKSKERDPEETQQQAQARHVESGSKKLSDLGY